MRRPALVFAFVFVGCGWIPSPAPTPEAGTHAEPAGDTAYYTCPMHPSVQQPGPGSCPICGMDLTPVKKSELESGGVQVDATRRARFGIALEAAAVRRMGTTLRIPAVTAWDADRLQDVSVRVAGWVKHVSGAPGESVKAGQTLFTLFSPELVAAQDDLLRATSQATGGDATATARAEAARLRLVRAGVSAAEVDTIVRGGHTVEDVPFRAPRSGWILERTAVEGGMVSPGQTLYRLGDLSKLWLEGAVPESALGAVAAGQPVTVVVPGRQGPIAAVVERILPEMDVATRTARIRVSLDNADGALRPDQWASIEVVVDDGEHLAVPEGAVLYTGPRRLVFVDAGGDLLMPREVEIGMKSEGYVQILSGLQAGEQVVRAGNFLVAADSRLKQGSEAGGGAAPAKEGG